MIMLKKYGDHLMKDPSHLSEGRISDSFKSVSMAEQTSAASDLRFSAVIQSPTLRDLSIARGSLTR